jgi:hypothetical protein
MVETGDVRTLTLLAISFAQLAFAEPAGRRPVLAYWVSHHDLPPPSSAPWSETSGLPRLVLYDDGLVVMTPTNGASTSTTIPSAVASSTFDAAGFFDLEDSYRGTNELHPPVHVITRWRGEVRKSVRFFGSLEDSKARAAAPASLLKALDQVTQYTSSSATPYVAERLVLRACLTKAAATKQKWPSEWALPDTGTKESVLPGCFVHVVPAGERLRAESLVPKGQSFTTIATRGTTWLVTLVRFALPAEEAWDGR